MRESWADIRFAWRILARSPVFALTASLLLGIGIGANTLIFSIVDTLLLRPLPVTHPEQLVRLIEVHPNGFVTSHLPHDLYDQLTANSSSVSEALCQSDVDAALEEGSSIERIRVNAVSPNFFSSLGPQAQFGRVLTMDDDKAARPVAVLSYDFWRRRFAGSRTIVGRSIRLNGHAFTIAGVLPRGANGLTVDTAPDMRVPLSASRLLVPKAASDPSDPVFDQLEIFARLRPGVSLRQAEAELGPRLRRASEDAEMREYPELAKGPRNVVLDSRLNFEPVGNGISSLRAQFSRGLMLLMACVGLLLLMACANVACLLLARSAARTQEITIRLALGANPWRVARQLLTESLVLAAISGTLGLVFAHTSMPLLLAALPPIRDRAAVVQPLAVHVDLNLRVLGFALLASVLTAILFGLSPALQGARQDLVRSLRGSRTTTARLSGRNILVVAQVAICVLLLIGSSLLVETFRRMQSMTPGFDRDHIVTFSLDPGLKGYPPERAKLLSQQLLEKTRTLPGVVGFGIATRGLMRGTGIKATLGVAGTPITRGDFLNSSLNSITPGYFDAIGMRVLAGRDFTWSDDNAKQKPRRVIVNEAFVRHFFPGGNALGKLFGSREAMGPAAPQNQIIGVVSDAKYRSLREPIPPTVYDPVVHGFDSDFILHLRTREQPSALIGPVRNALRSLDPELPFVEIRTLRQEVDTSLWQERLLAGLSTLFSCFAALLAALGLYAALDFAVRARTREIGVRVALGAAPFRILRMLYGETLLLVVMGALSGFALYALTASWIRQVLYGVAPSDPIAIASAVAVVAVITALATAAPIARAIRLDPTTALRHE